MNTRVNRLLGKLAHITAFLLGLGSVAWAQMPAPDPFVVTAVTANTVSLAWNDIYSDEDGFLLTRVDNLGNQATFQFGPDVTSYRDTNLITGKTYYYNVVAFNSGGQSSASYSQATPTPIAAPDPLLITGLTANTVGLSWNDIYTNEDGFLLTRVDNLGNQATFQFGPSVTNYLDTNLVTGKTYYYNVVAFNSGGQSYAAYSQATPTPVPAPDPLLITGVTANTVGLSWHDIYTNEDGFVLTRMDNLGNSAYFQFGPNVTNYLDTNLITGKTYYYNVVAFNSGGQSYAAYSQATPTPIPAPAPLAISGVTANTVGLVWHDIYDNEDGYILTRSDNLGNQAYFQFGPNVISYLDTNLVTGSTYYYQVVAFNSGGQSYPAYNSATPTPIAAPAPLLITGVTANAVGLSWNDIYSNEDGFLLTRSDNLANQANFQFGANVTNYTDTNLITGTTYYYQVKAFNSGGQSAVAYASATPTPSPSPAPLLVTDISSNAISLAWNDLFSNEDGFQLERSTDSVNFVVITLTGPNVTNYTDTPLSPASDYFYRVAAFNSAGLSAYATTNITMVPTPPAAPSGLTAVAVSPVQINLTWTDNAFNETQYYVERSTNGVDFTPAAIMGANATSESIVNVSPAHTYYFRVRAQNATGPSPWSSIASATTPDFPPPTPENFTATSVSTTEIDLNWTITIPYDWQGLININGYHIYISGDGTNFTFLDTVTNGWSYASTGLNPGTTYFYRVTSFNTAGDSEPTPVVSATTRDVVPPSGLSVTAISGSQIDLSWTDNATNESGFKVYISTNTFIYSLVATLGSNVTSYSSTGLRPLTTYYYRVTAFNSSSESAPSNVGNATTLDGVPVSPSGLKVTSYSTTLINLSWTDNANNESGFKVYISTDGTNFTLQATRGSNVTSYSSTGLIPGTTYYYRVTAFNAFGESAASSLTFTTPNVVPLSPTALSATAISATQINLSWTDNANNESGFKVYISTDGTNYNLLATLGTNVTTYASTGLNPATTYYYRVTAFNAVGESAAASANATIPDVVPVSPSALSATVISATQINLSWTDNANNETGFKVYISTNGTTFSVLATLGTNVTSYSSSGLNSATTYYYRVTAFNAIGESAASSANATTPDVVPAPPSGLSASGVSATQINLSWTDNANNEAGFKVYISTDGTTFSLLATLAANATSCSSTGLNSATTYYYRVTAFNAIGESAPASANATTPDVVPASPSGLSASVVSGTQINLSWTDNANNETGFKVYISTDGTTFSLLTTRGANVTSYLSTGLSLGTTYYYRVTAFNAVGESAPSNANATTPVVPAAPSSLSATGISTNQINLSWTDNATNESGFKVYIYNDATQIFNLLAILGANVTNYSSTNLNPVTAYTYRVTAFNAAGESTPVSASATTADFVPASPSDFSAIAASFGTQINLTWTDNANNETGFKVYMSTNGTTFSLLATIGYANVPFYTSTGLNPGTTYYFRVTTFNASGESAPASTTAITPDVPSSPSGLSAIALSTSQINLSWTDNATNETGFRVYTSTDGTNFNFWVTLGVNVTNYASTGLYTASTYYYRVTAFNDVGESTPASTNGTTDDVAPLAPWFLDTTTISATQVNLTWGDIAHNETGFKVYISTDATNFSLLDTVGPNVTSYSSTGLNPATTYYYRVTAFNAFGESAPSETASAATPDVLPLGPSGLSASAISSNLVTLNWTDNANNESGFLIERSTDGINFTQIASIGAGVTTYADSGLAAETTYYYRVRATNTAGNSAYSNIASATTGPDAPPVAPSNLTLTVISANQINLHWNDNSSNETQFLIERSLNGTSFTQIATVGANVQNFSATGLQSNTRYYFRVRATNSAGNSAYSNTPNAKTAPH